MTHSDIVKPITVALEDIECGTMRVGIGWVCSIYDVGQVPVAVIAMAKYVDREVERQKQSQGRK